MVDMNIDLPLRPQPRRQLDLDAAEELRLHRLSPAWATLGRRTKRARYSSPLWCTIGRLVTFIAVSLDVFVQQFYLDAPKAVVDYSSKPT